MEYFERVRVWGRQNHSTAVDMASFVERLVKAFLHVRFFQDFYWERSAYPEVSPETAVNSYLSSGGPYRGFMAAFDLSWEPIVSPLPDKPDKYRIDNLPTLLMRVHPGTEEKIELQKIKRTINVGRDGTVQINSGIDDVDEKRTAEKIVRVFRKGVTNKATLYDIPTMSVVRESEEINWFGADMGRRSREEENFFLQLYLKRDKEQFWAFKAPRD